MSNNFEFCPVCSSGNMEKEIITENFEYKGNHLSIPNFILYKCGNCGEAFHDKEQVKQNEKNIRDFQRTTDQLLSADEIRHVRVGLGFTQEKFGEILGGGTKAFARYENGTVTQSRPMDNLLRVLWHNPTGINIILRKPSIRTNKFEIPSVRYSYKEPESNLTYSQVGGK